MIPQFKASLVSLIDDSRGVIIIIFYMFIVHATAIWCFPIVTLCLGHVFTSHCCEPMATPHLGHVTS